MSIEQWVNCILNYIYVGETYKTSIFKTHNHNIEHIHTMLEQ